MLFNVLFVFIMISLMPMSTLKILNSPLVSVDCRYTMTLDFFEYAEKTFCSFFFLTFVALFLIIINHEIFI